jgi:hypothetical protein
MIEKRYKRRAIGDKRHINGKAKAVGDKGQRE